MLLVLQLLPPSLLEQRQEPASWEQRLRLVQAVLKATERQSVPCLNQTQTIAILQRVS